jgi:hypothetical protein
MTYQNETRPRGDAAGLGENAFSGGNCKSENAPNTDITQAAILPARVIEAQRNCSGIMRTRQPRKLPITRTCSRDILQWTTSPD